MKFALDVSIAGEYADPQYLAGLAADAEASGWDGFFVWDAVFGDPATVPMGDPWISLAAIASSTRRIRLGAMVTPLARRRPWQVARQTVALDRLSRGHLIFGVGLGYQDLDFSAFGEDPDARVRGEKLDEGLEILVGLWSGGPLSFTGTHYRVSSVEFLPKPDQTPRIPIWVAGYWPNPKPFRRAAKYEGVLPGKVGGSDLTPDELPEVISYVTSHRSSKDRFDIAVYGSSPSNGRMAAKVIRPWLQAGATWWREGIGDWRGPKRTVRARIRSGPPSI
jgi:alkanesulfonate monooxygenase SsuD/methylene tetrahydromethanopterin reductase-like flavin-dependent oxidoreductase (luciferase family)